MSFIVLEKWNPRNIRHAKKAIKHLADLFHPGMGGQIMFKLRPPGFYGNEDPLRQRGEVAWRYKGLE